MAWRAAAPGKWGNPVEVPGLLNLPVPLAVVSAGLVAAGASCWPRFPSLVTLAHSGDRAGAEEAYAAFEKLMEATGHRVPGGDNFARFLCEYGGNSPELLRRVLRLKDESVWPLSALPAVIELPFIRDAVDWGFL